MVNISSFYKKLRKSYSKNVSELAALKNKWYPDFVFERNPKTLRNEIPVFTFHSVEPNRFEEQLRFLSRNGYRTLKADELYEFLMGRKPIPQRALVLTFDDGWASLWGVAYPLLKKYGFCAVAFLIPGLVSESNSYYPNLNHFWNSKATFDEITSRELGSEPLCTWQEIREMHESGVIDCQSHSMYHHLVFISSTIEDFIHPSFDSHKKNLNVPLFSINGKENISRSAELGTPIYQCAPRYSGHKRYYDDEDLRSRCIEYVKLNGEQQFFRNQCWRSKLTNFVRQYRERHYNSGYFESEEELRQNIRNDMIESKRMIERRLPGKTVNHFCYPWWKGSDLAVALSKQVGYFTNFWGVLPKRRTNKCGDDSYKIVRLLSDDFIFRLPGEGRDSFHKIIERRCSPNFRRFISKLFQSD